MRLPPPIARLSLAVALLASLGACTVAPVYPVGYRQAPVYVETYPSYRYGPYPNTYYEYDRRYYGGRDDRYYQEPRRGNSAFDDAARLHRDVRRSLGLPRLPGMP